MKAKIHKYIEKWKGRGYPEDIPDEADAKLEAMKKVATYRMICKAILKNDVALTSLGYSKPACESYGVLKRIEIAARGTKV